MLSSIFLGLWLFTRAAVDIFQGRLDPMKNLKSIFAASALGLALTVGACDRDSTTAPTAAPDQNRPNLVTTQATSPIVREVTGTLQGGGRFVGTVTITSFSRDAVGNLLASGTLVGTAQQGSTITQITQTFVNVPVDLAQVSRTCRILHLDLGPIHLDVLGLNVDLSRVVLDITAVSGPGNLLGNLLCALVGLLDQFPINLTLLDSLLAQINAILAGL
jgi:hypothetical protein